MLSTLSLSWIYLSCVEHAHHQRPREPSRQAPNRSLQQSAPRNDFYFHHLHISKVLFDVNSFLPPCMILLFYDAHGARSRKHFRRIRVSPASDRLLDDDAYTFAIKYPVIMSISAPPEATIKWYPKTRFNGFPTFSSRLMWFGAFPPPPSLLRPVLSFEGLMPKANVRRIINFH